MCPPASATDLGAFRLMFTTRSGVAVNLKESLGKSVNAKPIPSSVAFATSPTDAKIGIKEGHSRGAGDIHVARTRSNWAAFSV